MTSRVATRTFETMRANLIARGLLTDDYRLTVAGHARVAQIKADLAASETSNDPDGPRVDWQIDFRRRGVPYHG